MHREASQEFYTCEGHTFLIGIISVILVGECNVMLVYVFDTRIADSHPMGIFGLVFHYLLRIAHRRFTVNYP